MWTPTASATLTVVNEADGDKSHYVAVPEAQYTASNYAFTGNMFVELAALAATPGFLVDDTLVLTVDIDVKHEARFTLDSGSVSSNLVLTLPSGANLNTHWHPLRMTSNVLCSLPESASLSVDGSLSAWTYIVVYHLHDAPALTLGGAYTLLPVAHKYGFTKLVTSLADYVKGQPLECDPQHPSKYIMSWVLLAERLQLDSLLEQCVKELGETPADGLARALLAGAGNGQVPAVLREQVKKLRDDANNLLAMTTSRLCAVERELAAAKAQLYHRYAKR
ncbi:hypothetical protein FOA52_007934 [Chlamydomonas sp. UWO 241]|nr:hypothetical protein FOA52_007934 [Chlamydomonas sp. UWO 241]